MKPRILFIGGTPRGFEVLKMLVKSREIPVFAYIMKEDRHETVKASIAIREFCMAHNIRLKICRRIGRGEIGRILKLNPGVAFVCGWRTMIPPAIYKEIPLGCIAAHDSLLPRYRGFAPLNWAIINGEKKTGVTLFKINDGVDSGPVFRQKVVKIGPQEAASCVYLRIISATVELYKEFISALQRNKVKWHKQDGSKATYASRRTPADGEIDWSKPAIEVFNLIRALSSPYPCAWTKDKSRIIRIAKASLPRKQLDHKGNIPGSIISVRGDGVLVLCGRGQIIINSVMTGKNKHVNAAKFFSSITTSLGNQEKI